MRHPFLYAIDFQNIMSLQTSTVIAQAVRTRVIANQSADWCGNPFPKAFPWGKVPAAAGG